MLALDYGGDASLLLRTTVRDCSEGLGTCRSEAVVLQGVARSPGAAGQRPSLTSSAHHSALSFTLASVIVCGAEAVEILSSSKESDRPSVILTYDR